RVLFRSISVRLFVGKVNVVIRTVLKTCFVSCLVKRLVCYVAAVRDHGHTVIRIPGTLAGLGRSASDHGNRHADYQKQRGKLFHSFHVFFSSFFCRMVFILNRKAGKFRLSPPAWTARNCPGSSRRSPQRYPVPAAFRFLPWIWNTQGTVLSPECGR